MFRWPHSTSGSQYFGWHVRRSTSQPPIVSGLIDWQLAISEVFCTNIVSISAFMAVAFLARNLLHAWHLCVALLALGEGCAIWKVHVKSRKRIFVQIELTKTLGGLTWFLSGCSNLQRLCYWNPRKGCTCSRGIRGLGLPRIAVSSQVVQRHTRRILRSQRLQSLRSQNAVQDRLQIIFSRILAYKDMREIYDFSKSVLKRFEFSRCSSFFHSLFKYSISSFSPFLCS